MKTTSDVNALGSQDGFFTTSDGVKLHYLSAGTGATIVFIPGWTMPAWIWENQIEYFAQRYHVVALDPRAQGESDLTTEGLYPERRAQDVFELVAHLNGAPVVLVGWSEGAAVLLHYVELFGTDTISALALFDGEFKMTEPGRRETEKLMHEFLHNRAVATEGFVRWMYKTPQTEEYIQRVIAASLRIPTASALTIQLDYLSREPEWNKTQVLASIDRPLLYGATLPWQSYAIEAQTLLPSVRIELFTEAGHAVFVDEAQRFNSLLEELIKRAHESIE
jgi:non-heme chloroperoxidase